MSFCSDGVSVTKCGYSEGGKMAACGNCCTILNSGWCAGGISVLCISVLFRT